MHYAVLSIISVYKWTRLLGHAVLFTYREHKVDEKNEIFNHTLAAIHFGSLQRSEIRYNIYIYIFIYMDYLDSRYGRYILYCKDILLCNRGVELTFQSKMHCFGLYT